MIVKKPGREVVLQWQFDSKKVLNQLCFFNHESHQSPSIIEGTILHIITELFLYSDGKKNPDILTIGLSISIVFLTTKHENYISMPTIRKKADFLVQYMPGKKIDFL